MYDQIEEQGAEWGLVPVWRGNRVGVAEVVAEIDPRPAGRPQVQNEGRAVLASFGEDAPMDAFAILLARRKHRSQHNFAALVKKRDDRLKREREQVMADMKRDIVAKYRAKYERSRTLFGPGIHQRERVW